MNSTLRYSQSVIKITGVSFSLGREDCVLEARGSGVLWDHAAECPNLNSVQSNKSHSLDFTELGIEPCISFT